MENISDQECKKQLQLIQEITSQNNRSEFIAHGLPYKEIVAISCEFVQSEETYGSKTSLSKISLVDYSGAVLLDSKVKNDSNSEDQKDQRLKYQVVRAKALSLIYGKVLVGYQLETCLKILNMNRPDCMLRDIQICPYLRDKSVSKGEGLNLMVKRILGKDMQEEMNNTLDNGRAIMCLYRLIEELWENDFAKQTAEKLKNVKILIEKDAYKQRIDNKDDEDEYSDENKASNQRSNKNNKSLKDIDLLHSILQSQQQERDQEEQDLQKQIHSLWVKNKKRRQKGRKDQGEGLDWGIYRGWMERQKQREKQQDYEHLKQKQEKNVKMNQKSQIIDNKQVRFEGKTEINNGSNQLDELQQLVDEDIWGDVFDSDLIGINVRNNEDDVLMSDCNIDGITNENRREINEKSGEREIKKEKQLNNVKLKSDSDVNLNKMNKQEIEINEENRRKEKQLQKLVKIEQKQVRLNNKEFEDDNSDDEHQINNKSKNDVQSSQDQIQLIQNNKYIEENDLDIGDNNKDEEDDELVLNVENNKKSTTIIPQIGNERTNKTQNRLIMKKIHNKPEKQSNKSNQDKYSFIGKIKRKRDDEYDINDDQQKKSNQTFDNQNKGVKRQRIEIQQESNSKSRQSISPFRNQQTFHKSSSSSFQRSSSSSKGKKSVMDKSMKDFFGI